MTAREKSSCRFLYPKTRRRFFKTPRRFYPNAAAFKKNVRHSLLSSCRTLPKMKKKEGYYAKNIHKITVY
jgi:hypothetical protein